MKIEVSENGNLILTEIYSPIGIKTPSNETIILMMRDSGFEIFYENNFFSLQKGKIKSGKQIKKESKKKWYDIDDAEECLFDF